MCTYKSLNMISSGSLRLFRCTIKSLKANRLQSVNRQLSNDNASSSEKFDSGESLYSESNNRFTNKKDPRLRSFRPESVPADQTSIFLFPGQGSQYVGMCSSDLTSLPAVKSMFNKANHILGYDLLRMCQKGPAFDLEQTLHCQPAIFVASLAGTLPSFALSFFL